MHRRVVLAVSAALFALLGLVAALVTDLHDRDFPQALDVRARMGLDFEESGLDEQQVLAALTEQNARYDLGLYRIVPNLDDDRGGQVFVAFESTTEADTFEWFNDPVPAAVAGPQRLANSSPNGSYLITGPDPEIDAFMRWLDEAGVTVALTRASTVESLRFAVRETGFASALLAVLALVATLALFWLSMRSRSRALRVLAGCPATRIQAQDLGGLAGLLLLSGAAVTALACGYVALTHGLLFVDVYLRILLGLILTMIVVSSVVVLVMSMVAWPDTAMIATRQPALRSLRVSAGVLQAVTFVLVLAAVGPTWSAYRNASSAAAETARWRSLADQVVLRFGMSDAAMTSVEPQVGGVVAQAQANDALVFSYTVTADRWVGDLDGYSAVAFVNQRWLQLMSRSSDSDHLRELRYDSVRDMIEREFTETVALWSRDSQRGEQALSDFEYLTPATGFPFPVATGGSGSLEFFDDVLLVVVPSVHATFNDRNLTSMASTRNLLFTDPQATEKLLEQGGLSVQALRERGLPGRIAVVYAAEDGILRAQFLAYLVSLMALSLVALAVAFLVSAGISAFITALRSAKRDFPLILAGRSWSAILKGRVVREICVGAVLVVGIVLARGFVTGWPVAAAAAIGATVVPLSHRGAVGWSFEQVGRRRM